MVHWCLFGAVVSLPALMLTLWCFDCRRKFSHKNHRIGFQTIFHLHSCWLLQDHKWEDVKRKVKGKIKQLHQNLFTITHRLVDFISKCKIIFHHSNNCKISNILLMIVRNVLARFSSKSDLQKWLFLPLQYSCLPSLYQMWRRCDLTESELSKCGWSSSDDADTRQPCQRLDLHQIWSESCWSSSGDAYWSSDIGDTSSDDADMLHKNKYVKQFALCDQFHGRFHLICKTRPCATKHFGNVLSTHTRGHFQ